MASAALGVFAAQFVVVCAGIVGLGLWLRRRFATSWRTWWWGALAFIGSQVVRVPLLGAFAVVAPDVAAGVTLSIVVISSGVFEESARYLVLRFGATDARRWRDGVMFGAGHGGIEAIIVIGGAAAGAVLLLAAGDQLLETVTATSPDQADALAEQIEAVRDVSVGEVALGAYERVLAVIFHIAASLLVLRAVQTRAWRWLGMAMAFHALFNTVALVVVRTYGALAAEVALTVFTVVSVLIVRSERTRDDDVDVQTAPPPSTADDDDRP